MKVKEKKKRRERIPDISSEARLKALREEASRGVLIAKGIRPPGAPFPVASPEAGYYGIPLLKPPQWRWEIPAYFFVGGAAGASAVIAAVAEFTGGDPRLVRDAKLQAAVGGVISPALLVADLGRPARFLNMLRIFKPQSVMSVGAWNVMLFSMSSVAAAIAEALSDLLPRFARPLLTAAPAAVSAATGAVMTSYTGVLIGVTSVPVWNRNLGSLPGHFAASGMNAAVGVLEWMGHDDSRPLNALGIAAAAVETLEGAKLESDSAPVHQPLKEGRSGWIVRAGGILSGPVPLALRLASLFVSRPRAARLRRVAAACAVAGSVLTRFGWMEAGRASTHDYRLPLELPARTTDTLPQPALNRIPAD